ncbi:hypothetical protein NAEGRDRAFT_57460 [Naegleria gruberi]|uniref:Mannosyl-oligosaccharide glucosidase n=1 Tax=Naegleria gruberi TaxID=5762 RepID=D2V8G8_NAEGR|nr:uncharacterized protein NAEGRDRAFT_57460 [Naegleria gruberi]EFC46681.1 hypothetical protein NAEGRDRAFT_57460 [Naegleria gruberi]|eukprot:XP_002679425.1 hypothetical protein NAEGRDRAFT_57460 [Naegleria gruberi strain NEG-M]
MIGCFLRHHHDGSSLLVILSVMIISSLLIIINSSDAAIISLNNNQTINHQHHNQQQEYISQFWMNSNVIPSLLPSHKSRASRFYYSNHHQQQQEKKAIRNNHHHEIVKELPSEKKIYKGFATIDSQIRENVYSKGAAATSQDFLLPRPKMYSGIQTKDSDPLYFGIAWNEYDNQQWNIKVRENVYTEDIQFNCLKVERADPLTFSKVIVVDQYLTNVRLNITTVKYGGVKNNAFAVKITGESMYDPRKKEKVDDHIAVYLYTGVTKGEVYDMKTDSNGQLVLQGVDDSSYGSFRMRTSSVKGANTEKTKWRYDNALESFYFVNETDRPYYAKQIITDTISSGVGNDYNNNPACCQNGGNHFNLLPNKKMSQKSNIGIIQKVLKTPFEWVITFDNPNANPLTDLESSPAYIDHLYEKYKQEFEQKFDDRFPVTNFINTNTQKASAQDYREFGMQVVSSLMFGLSYFEGSGYFKNMSDPANPIIVMKNRKLLSLIPNKQSFPRPFYWDEAFMEMVQVRWNREVFEEVTRNWHFDAILDDITGWIDREQFIGEEARYQQPQWAWYGLSNQMNPPVYFITLERYCRMYDKNVVIDYFNRTGLFERLQKILAWYLKNLQAAGSEEYTYRWGGRVFDVSLDSGLDDYPRFMKVLPGESNVDLQAWIAKAAQVMSDLSQMLSKPKDLIDYYASISNIISKNLHDLFWNESIGFYVDRSKTLGFANHIGYIGMLPVCLGIETNMTRVEKTIEKMSNSDYLWYEEGGIISLSYEDITFERSGQYWRGALWAPFQYQCARGLAFYENNYKLNSAKIMRKKIQTAYVNNVVKHYHVNDNSIGAIYETYHPTDGRGFNNHPFTGWSALVVLLMSEDYQ